MVHFSNRLTLCLLQQSLCIQFQRKLNQINTIGAYHSDNMVFCCSPVIEQGVHCMLFASRSVSVLMVNHLKAEVFDWFPFRAVAVISRRSEQTRREIYDVNLIQRCYKMRPIPLDCHRATCPQRASETNNEVGRLLWVKWLIATK